MTIQQTQQSKDDAAIQALGTAEGTQADAAQTDATQTASEISWLKGLVKILADVWDAANHWLKAQLQAGENHVGEVGGRGIEAVDEFQRPNDATAYTINDRLAAATTDTATTPLRGLTLARANGKAFWLTYWKLTSDDTAFLAPVRVHIYTVSQPPTAVPGDNAAFPIKYANVAKRIGHFDLPALAASGAAAGTDQVSAVRDDLRIHVVPDAADTKVYYAYELLAANAAVAQKHYHTMARSDAN